MLISGVLNASETPGIRGVSRRAENADRCSAVITEDSKAL